MHIFLCLIKLEAPEALSSPAYLWETVGLLPVRGCLLASVCAATCVCIIDFIRAASELCVSLYPRRHSTSVQHDREMVFSLTQLSLLCCAAVKPRIDLEQKLLRPNYYSFLFL